MDSNTIKFLYNEKILELKNPDPNQTILNFVRTELKKLEQKNCAEEAVELVQ